MALKAGIIQTPYSKAFKVFEGAQFTVKGSSLKDAHHRFSINLSTQAALEPTTSLHFELRFDVDDNEKKVVLNSVEDGKWGVPQVEDNPFVLNSNFEVNIKCTGKSFKIKFGGKEAEFNYRGLPMTWVNYIYIEGEAILSEVKTKP